MHPLRGLVVRLCLCLCVLFAQGVASVHAFEHLHRHDTPTLAASDAADAICALCLATGGLGAALGSTALPAIVVPAIHSPTSGTCVVPHRQGGGYLARAPPTA